MVETAQVVEEKLEQDNDETQMDSKTQVQPAQFPDVAPNDSAGAGASIDIILDMSIPVTVAIGQTEISIRRFLQLGPGSVLKLDKSIDTPADLYLKDTKFATGSIVVVDGQFGVRIQQIFGIGDSIVKAVKPKKV